MEFNAIEEKCQNDYLINAWHGGKNNIDEVARIVAGLAYRMHSNAEIACYHISLIKEIADSSLPIAKAHMILLDCYRRGHGVEIDPYLALDHLEKAINIGSNEARWWYANFLVKNEGLESVLDTNPEKALNIYRELAWDEQDITIISLARYSAVPLLIKGKHSGQLSFKDEELIRQYSENWQCMSSLHYYDLARFYSDGIESKNYSSPEYRYAKNLLVRGMEKSASSEIKQKCEALLDEWGIKPIPPLPPTRAQKVVEGTKIVISLGYAVTMLVVWSFIGMILLSITTWITIYITIPIMGLLAVFGIIAIIRKK